MPKISSQQVTVEIDGIRQAFGFQVLYDQDFRFYAAIPPAFEDQFDQLTKLDQIKFSTAIKYQYKYERGNQTRIVKSDTEDGLVESMKKLLSRLVSLTLTKEQVIIISFEDESAYHTDEEDRNELPRIGLSLSATYCTRISSPGAEPQHWKIKQTRWMGEQRTIRSSVFATKNQIIIPDTPENRKFIEDLHGALGALLVKFKEFTASPESVLSFIAGSQKLLN